MLKEEFKTNTDIYAQARRFRIPVASSTNKYSNGEFVPLYTSRVHRLLQVSANILEATIGTSKYSETAPVFPRVFRPQFELKGGDLYITNYVKVINDPTFPATVYIVGIP